MNKKIKILLKNILLLFNIRIHLYHNSTKIVFFNYEIIFNRKVVQFQFLDLYPSKRPEEPLYLNIGGGDFVHPLGSLNHLN